MDVDEEIVVSPGRSQLEITTSSLQSGKEHQPADAETGLTKRRQRRLQSTDWVRLPAVTDDLEDDFVEYGFSPVQAKEMSHQPQKLHDPWKHPWKDPFSREFRLQEERVRKEERESDNKRRKLISKHQPLALNQNSNWVLFDPGVHSFPLSRGGETPASFKQYELFRPGNARIVEFNIGKNNHSVRLRSTPTLLRGKRIEYGTTGPKIFREGSGIEERVEEDTLSPPPAELPQPAKRRPGRPRKTAAPEFTSVHGKSKSVSKKGAGRPRGRPRKAVIKLEPVEDSGSDLSGIEEV